VVGKWVVRKMWRRGRAEEVKETQGEKVGGLGRDKGKKETGSRGL